MKSGSIRRQFKQDTTWLTEVNRLKVLPVAHVAHVKPEINQMLAPFQLIRLGCNSDAT